MRSLRLRFYSFRLITCAVAFGFVLTAARATAQELGKLPYVPTPQIVVDEMLKLAGVTANDFVIDLGSGDGRVILTAAQKFKAHGLGVDIDKSLVALSNKQSKAEGVEDRAKFIEQDMFKADISKATVVTLYVLPDFMYVAEIAPGGALNPERHLYEEMICILAGHGATEIWQDGGPKRLFEWGPFSLFAPPLNSWHRLVNGGREPVRFMAVTTAPIAMDFYRNPEFIFNCPFTFDERFHGEDSYFAATEKFYAIGMKVCCWSMRNSSWLASLPAAT